jgi:hypothetical protein
MDIDADIDNLAESVNITFGRPEQKITAF